MLVVFRREKFLIVYVGGLVGELMFEDFPLDVRLVGRDQHMEFVLFFNPYPFMDSFIT